jgi:hypothetical protein
MIKKYEGFFSNIFKKKEVNKKDINYNEIVKISIETFTDLTDSGFSLKNSYDLNENFYVQITKHYRGRQHKDIPYKFIKVKDDVLSFYDRVKEIEPDCNIKFSFVYENKEGGLSSKSPKYEEFERGDYDNREVEILTIWIEE